MSKKQLNVSTKDRLSSLSPKGDREPRFVLKYPGFIYKKFLVHRLQATGGWAHSPQATSVKQIILFF